MRRQRCPGGSSFQIWIRASVRSSTDFGAAGSFRIRWYMVSQRCPIGFRSCEPKSLSTALMTSSSRSWRHTLTTRIWSSSCTRRSLEHTARAWSQGMGLKFASLYLTAIKVPFWSPRSPVWTSIVMPPDHKWPTTEWVILNDVACRISLSTTSPDLVKSVHELKSKPTVLHEQ